MYRPLPDGLTIKQSEVQGLGLFATKDFDADVVLGIVHIENKNFPKKIQTTCSLSNPNSPGP